MSKKYDDYNTIFEESYYDRDEDYEYDDYQETEYYERKYEERILEDY